MNDDEKAYMRYRVMRAQQSLELAKLALDNGFFHDAVNRLYYAAFYGVSALLLAKGFASSKHSGVIALFDRHWINTGLVPKEMGHLFHLLFRRRQESDYVDLVEFNYEQVEKWADNTRLFLEIITSQIEKETGELGSDKQK